MNKYFVTFGTKKYYNSINRIVNEAKEFNFFDFIFNFDESIFDNNFNKILEKKERGYGFWLWKPYIILQTLNLMNENDILIYCDSGCKLFIEAKKRLQEYFSLLEKSEYCSLSFQLRYIEKDWTKRDLLELFKGLENTNQLMATSFLLKKNKKSLELVNNWLNISLMENQHFINDTLSRLPNYPSFQDHRHDQSIFSLLRKAQGTLILGDEVDETDGVFPIRAFRIRTDGILIKEPLNEYFNNDLLKLLILKTNKLIILCKISDYKLAKNINDKNIFIHYYNNYTLAVSQYVNYTIISIKDFIMTNTSNLYEWIKENKSLYLLDKIKSPFTEIQIKNNWLIEKKYNKDVIFIEEYFENDIALLVIKENNYIGKLTEINIDEYDIIQGKKFRDYFNLIRFRYNNTIFCKTDFLPMLNCDYINNIILITSSSDYPITDELVNHLNNKVKKWYGVNIVSKNKKCIPIPLGITSYDTNQLGKFIGFSNDITESHYILGNVSNILHIRNTPKKIINLMYMNFDTNTNEERKNIKTLFSTKNWVTNGILDKTMQGRIKFLEQCHNHYYVICPRGNGIDTHRIWETLYIGSIPVVLLEEGLESFQDLPILFINNWNIVTKEFLESKISYFYNKIWNLEKLFFSYWKNKISVEN